MLVVDSTGAGGAFTTIQPAINAATDGDVILIKSGFYPSGTFNVNDKALTFVEDAGATATFVSATITNPNGKTVAMRGLRFLRNSPAVAALNPARNLHVIDNTGMVWLEDCVFETDDFLAAAAGASYPAIETTNSEDAGGTLMLIRCTVIGTRGVRTPEGMMQAGVAIKANTHANDGLVIWESLVQGGHGDEGFAVTSVAGGDGGNAIEVAAGFFVSSGGAAIGGDGGDGGIGGGGCTNAGDGGHGLVLQSVGAQYLGTVFTGGAGGSATGACSAGAPGSGVVGTITQLTGVPNSVEVTTPVLDTTSTTATYQGAPLATVYPYYSFAVDLAAVPGVLLPTVLDSVTLASLPQLTLDAGGSGSVVYPLNNVVPSTQQALVLYVQPLQVSGSTAVSGAPSLLVVLN